MKELELKLLNALALERSPDCSHGLSHLKRVWKNVQIISSEIENLDWEIMMASTFLHDIKKDVIYVEAA